MKFHPNGIITSEQIKDHASKLSQLVLPPENSYFDPDNYHYPKFVKKYQRGFEKSQGYTDLCRSFAKGGNVSRDDTVADLGCGTGFLTAALQDFKPKRLYAIDPALAMLSVMVDSLDTSELTIIHGSIDELAASQLPKAHKIFSLGVYGVVDNPLLFLRKVFDYLPDGGSYLFTEEDYSQAFIGGEDYDEVYEKFSVRIEEIMGKEMPRPEKSSKVFNPDIIIEQVNEAGGMIKDMYRLPYRKRVCDILTGMEDQGWPERLVKLYNDEFLTVNGQEKEIMDRIEQVFVTAKA